MPGLHPGSLMAVARKTVKPGFPAPAVPTGYGLIRGRWNRGGIGRPRRIVLARGSKRKAARLLTRLSIADSHLRWPRAQDANWPRGEGSSLASVSVPVAIVEVRPKEERNSGS